MVKTCSNSLSLDYDVVFALVVSMVYGGLECSLSYLTLRLGLTMQSLLSIKGIFESPVRRPAYPSDGRWNAEVTPKVATVRLSLTRTGIFLYYQYLTRFVGTGDNAYRNYRSTSNSLLSLASTTRLRPTLNIPR
jgi:hypothetical protein